MNNISTIYRFYTPFLDIDSEKNNLWGVLKKIQKSLEFDGMVVEKKLIENEKYLLYILDFGEDTGKIEFYYIRSLEKDEYYFPIFKMDIFLESNFLSASKTKDTISFLNNIFECFDGLNEKEYLIDISNSIYYESLILRKKTYPSYDFLNLERIRRNFESRSGYKLLQDFIINLQNGDFVLTESNSFRYHRFYGILLYFLYLVYIMDYNIAKTSRTIEQLESIDDRIENINHINLMKRRLSYIDKLSVETYQNYKGKLEVFFNLLDKSST